MRKLNTDEFVLKAKNVHNNLYTYTKTTYINTSTKCIITCKKHGDFTQTPRNHLQGQGCPICEEKRRKSWNKDKIIKKDIYVDRVKESCETNNLKFIELSKKNKWGVVVQCNDCGYKYDVYSYDIDRFGCPKCANKRRSEFQKKTELWKKNLKIKGEFKHLLTSRAQYEGFEYKRSSYEDDIYNYISLFVGEEIILINDRSVLYPYELDIYIPSLKIALEFNGTYWHNKNIWEEYKSKENCEYDQCREQYKYLECKKRNIKLIHIWEDDWLKDSDSILKNIKKEIIYAREKNISS